MASWSHNALLFSVLGAFWVTLLFLSTLLLTFLLTIYDILTDTIAVTSHELIRNLCTFHKGQKGQRRVPQMSLRFHDSIALRSQVERLKGSHWIDTTCIRFAKRSPGDSGVITDDPVFGTLARLEILDTKTECVKP